jgi:hypothetical protein
VICVWVFCLGITFWATGVLVWFAGVQSFLDLAVILERVSNFSFSDVSFAPMTTIAHWSFSYAVKCSSFFSAAGYFFFFSGLLVLGYLGDPWLAFLFLRVVELVWSLIFRRMLLRSHRLVRFWFLKARWISLRSSNDVFIVISNTESTEFTIDPRFIFLDFYHQIILLS